MKEKRSALRFVVFVVGCFLFSFFFVCLFVCLFVFFLFFFLGGGVLSFVCLVCSLF